VLLYKQVPGVDLVDYNDLHGDTIRQHELQRGGDSQHSISPSLLRFRISPSAQGKSLNCHIFEKGTATQNNIAPGWQRYKTTFSICGCCLQNHEQTLGTASPQDLGKSL
jgi:hypothetical protein